MTHHQFDDVTIAAATGSRRALWQAVAGLALGGAAVAGLATDDAEAARANCKKKFKQMSASEVKRYIRKAANKYNTPYKQMVCVAECESGFDPCAYNKSGPWYGNFQFLKSTFNKTSYGDKNIYHPKWNALAAAELWSKTPKNQLGNVWTCYKIANCGKK